MVNFPTKFGYWILLLGRNNNFSVCWYLCRTLRTTSFSYIRFFKCSGFINVITNCSEISLVDNCYTFSHWNSNCRWIQNRKLFSTNLSRRFFALGHSVTFSSCTYSDMGATRRKRKILIDVELHRNRRCNRLVDVRSHYRAVWLEVCILCGCSNIGNVFFTVDNLRI